MIVGSCDRDARAEETLSVSDDQRGLGIVGPICGEAGGEECHQCD